MFVVGASVLGFSGRRGNGREVTIDREVTGHDTGYFLICFTIAAGAGIVTLPGFLKIILGVALVAVYGLLRVGTSDRRGRRPRRGAGDLYLWPGSSTGPTWAAAAQLVGALAIMATGAHFFVDAVEHGSEALGIPAGLIALVLAPLGDGAAGEVQLYYLGQGGQRRSGARQHYRGHGLPEHDTGYSWFDLYAVATELHQRLRGCNNPRLGAAFYLLLRSKQQMRASYLMAGGVMYLVFLVAAVVTVL